MRRTPDITSSLPPSPPGRLPLLGHVLSLARRPLEFVQAVRSYGRVAKIYIGVKPAYFVNDPELIRDVLVSRAKEFDKGPLFANARVIVGNGLATAEGELHRRQRRLLQPAFHRSRITLYTRAMGELATARAAAWRAGQVVAVNDEMANLTLAVAARTLFSASADEEVHREVRRWLPIMMKGVFLRAILPFAFVGRLPTPSNREFNQSLVRLKQVLSDIVTARRREEAAHDDLLSMLLMARDPDSGEAMTDQQVHDEIITLMIGGIESTAAALSWAFYELGRHPGIEERIHAEVDAALVERALPVEEVPKLEYTTRFIKEILRLYAPWLLTRRALSTLELGGVRIPAGSTVLYSPYAVHHDQHLYPEPTRLDPDRWLADPVRKRPQGSFIPFGAGVHQCIGESFAFMEMISILATVAGRWRLRPVATSKIYEAVTGAVHPSELPMEVQPRHG